MRKNAVVLDIGSGYTKSGFSGDFAPRSIIASCVARLTSKPVFHVDGIEFSYPIHQGIITNWDDYVNLLHTIYYGELGVEPHHYPALMTVPLFTNKKQREKIAELAFEAFKVPKLSLKSQPQLALYESGRLSGNVIDSGDSMTTSVCMSMGNVDYETVNKINIGGKDIANVIRSYLTEKGHTNLDLAIIKHIQETECYINTKLPKEKTDYQLPDGKRVTLDQERYVPGEILFNPYLIKQTVGIQQLVDSRRDTVVCLTGGNVLLPGFVERFSLSVPRNIDVISSSNAQIATFIGGSMLGSMDSPWITEQEFKERGVFAVHK
jgi:actin-related protein